jgi:UDP-N-acetylglucosamine/UDP-N-acetylgalactosamine diphosphorylase
MTHAPPELLHRLKMHGQEHVLAGWDTLPPVAREKLVAQLAGIDFAELKALYARKNEPHAVLPPREQIAPLPVQPTTATAEAIAAGEDALRRGEVAALCVAGGQGSRLGFDKPKGMFPVGPVSGASLFQIHADKVLALSRKYGKSVPLLLMTSPATDADTRAYFAEHGNFGLDPAQVVYFEQGTMPSLDMATGRLLLEKPGELFLSPNGHGGTLTALSETGLLAELKGRGVKEVFYFQVDNPLVKICDPGFVGRHVLARGEASSKVVMKELPEEKVGVLAVINGKCGIIEYSDLPPAMAAERDDAGQLLFRAGSPAIHLFNIAFLERVTAKGTGLNFHVARKKVPHFDPQAGTALNPERENALKFEMFIFDALPMAERWLAVETPRAEEFAPLKNATGADSPETARAAISALHSGWLKRAGIDANGFAVEVSPLFALDAGELARKIPRDTKITGPTYLR